jgi:hypothetical protein
MTILDFDAASSRAAASMPSSTAAPSDPFSDRFGARLPRELRTEAAGMSWTAFEAAYAGGPHLIELTDWAMHRLGATQIAFEATLTYRGKRHSVATTCSGPIAALTGILYDLGVNIEILSLHQMPVDGRTATFIHAERDGQRHWAMAIGDNGVNSSLHAVVAAANYLFG